jgi:hypothetical protein
MRERSDGDEGLAGELANSATLLQRWVEHDVHGTVQIRPLAQSKICVTRFCQVLLSSNQKNCVTSHDKCSKFRPFLTENTAKN